MNLKKVAIELLVIGILAAPLRRPRATAMWAIRQRTACMAPWAYTQNRQAHARKLGLALPHCCPTPI